MDRPRGRVVGRRGKWEVYIFLLVLCWNGVTTTTTTTTGAPTTTTPQPQPSLPQDALPSPRDVFSRVTLRKCACDMSEVLLGSQCFDHATLIPVYNSDFAPRKDAITPHIFGYALNANDFENATVGEPECSEGLVPVHVSEEDGLFYILPDGQLLWQEKNYVYDEYCIEQVVLDGALLMEAHVCMPPEPVPRCCPVNEVVNKDGSCGQADRPVAFTPPVMVGSRNLSVVWPVMDTGDQVTITCEGNNVLRHISLSAEEGSLLGMYHKPALHWTSPVWNPSSSFIEDFCVGVELVGEESQYVAQFCSRDHVLHHQQTCHKKSCVRKCCPLNNLLVDFDDGIRCAEAMNEDEFWRPWRLPGQNLTQGPVPADEWTYVIGGPLCVSENMYIHDNADQITILSNGHLHLGPNAPSVPSTDYCLDNLLDKDGNLGNSARLCFPEKSCVWRDTLISVVMGVSCVFLAVTLAVYLSVPDLRNKTNGRCITSMVAAMLTTYICLMFHPNKIEFIVGCYINACVTHLSSLAMFFWLNVMCFDMWSTLRTSRKQYHSKKVFMMYSLYAWGCPLLVTLVTLALDLLRPPNAIIPEFEEICWFHGNDAYWLYFGGFVCILTLVNLAFFVRVAVILFRKFKQRKENFESGTSHTNKATKTKQKVWLYMKLFVVMGVVWIAETASGIQHRKICSYYWVLTDVLNGLQGVLIFVVTVCNKDKLKKIKDAWRPRVQRARQTLTSLQNRRPSQAAANANLSIDDTDASRKTSITSLPRKISQVSNIFLPSGCKSTATLNASSDVGNRSPDTRKGSTVSAKEVIPLSTMPE